MDGTMLTSDLRKALKDQRTRMGKKNKLKHRGDYVSTQFVQELFTQENVRRELGRLQLDQTAAFLQDPDSLVNFIQDRASKIFAILVDIDRGRRIANLQNRKPIVDDHFLFSNHDGDPSKPYCTLEKLRGIQELSDVASEIYRTQWVFPTVLSPANDLEFDPKFFKFPFQTPSEYIGCGASGPVHGVELERGYLKGRDGTDVIFKVAYKKIRHEQQSGGHMRKIMEEVKFMRSRQHDNLLPLLASFVAGLESVTNPEDPTKCLYLLSRLAETNMHEWLAEEPAYIKEVYKPYDSQDFTRHILDSMRGLAAGVAYIHKQIGYYVGYHGDIKPRNILRFGSSGTEAWKICDFGTSNLKQVQDTGTRNADTTLYWAPEEFLTNPTEEWNHGRSHDVWSLGCVFLLLATVQIHRWRPEGLKSFQARRARGGTNEEDHAFYKCMKEITEWINELKEECQESGDLLDLIQEMLTPREARIFSWEGVVDLSTITSPGRKKEEILAHLRDVIQGARDVDRQLKHNPMTRARRDPRKRGEFLTVLLQNGWSDHETTPQQKKACEDRRSLSTLPTLDTGDNTLVTDAALKDLAQRLKRTKSVALVGLRSVGKSLLALHYAAGISKQNQQSSLPARDVFWVRAHNMEDFDDSYTAIAAKFTIDDPGFRSKKKLWKYVKHRLEQPSTKEWLMVVDGFDQHEVTQIIKLYLPRVNDRFIGANGKILFTTRNSLLVRHLVEWNMGRAYIEMQCPDESTAMKLFCAYFNPTPIEEGSTRADPTLIKDGRTYGDSSLVEEGSTYATQLLQEFNWPELIRRIAQEMIHSKKTCGQMHEYLKTRKYEKMERLVPNFAERLLVPVLGASMQDNTKWTSEMRLLMLLCLFDNKTGVELSLLHTDCPENEHQQVDESLDKLLACHFVRKKDTTSICLVYFVDKTVDLAVRTWMEANETPNCKLERYSKALSTLFNSYSARKKAEKKNRRKNPARKQQSFASFKAILMPHFMRFVEFAEEHRKTELNFVLHYRAVQAVLVFSDVLLHEGDFASAVVVLEFTRKHFKPEGHQRHRSTYFVLGKLLANTYLSRPKDKKSAYYFDEAERLIESLQQEAKSSNHTQMWEGRRLLAWELGLEMVRVFWKIQQFDKAWSEFDNVSKIGVKVKNGKVLPPPGDTSYSPSDKLDLKTIAIRVKWEESLLNYAHGERHKDNREENRASRCWKAAYDACIVAKNSARDWDLEDDKLESEMAVHQAKILIKLGSIRNLNEAERILEGVLESCLTQGGVASKRRAWDIEYRVNYIKLTRRYPQDLDSAKESLGRLVADTLASLGKKDVLTRHVAMLAAEAYEETGNSKDLRELAKRFGQLPRFEKRSWWAKCLDRLEEGYRGNGNDARELGNVNSETNRCQERLQGTSWLERGECSENWGFVCAGVLFAIMIMWAPSA